MTAHPRVVMIGPLPPPIDGQSMVLSHLASHLRVHLPNLIVADTAAGGLWAKLARTVRACRSIPGSDTVYVAVKAGHGMWLNVLMVLVARRCGARIFLHHHSYSYLHGRPARMVALTRAAGPAAQHIVLARSMADTLRAQFPEITAVPVINNAGLVDRSLLRVPIKADGAAPVLGHLSNLYVDKGIGEVVDLAVALNRAGTRARLIVAGPPTQAGCMHHLARAARELGDLFDYRGPVTGAAKHAFFEDITHFVFPSSYLHESVPLVLHEAMAAGAVCLSTRRGSIPEQVAGGPAVLAADRDTFVAEVLPVLVGTSVSAAASVQSRAVFTRALDEFDQQLREFVAHTTADSPLHS